MPDEEPDGSVLDDVADRLGFRAFFAKHAWLDLTYRVVVGLIGATVVVIGFILIPLPGPGWLIVAVGVFMLALEFDRAERLLEKILDRLEDVSEQAQSAGPWAKAGLALIALSGLAATIAAFVLFDVPLLPG